jgi:DNA polymerase, archaea type
LNLCVTGTCFEEVEDSCYVVISTRDEAGNRVKPIRIKYDWDFYIREDDLALFKATLRKDKEMEKHVKGYKYGFTSTDDAKLVQITLDVPSSFYDISRTMTSSWKMVHKKHNGHSYTNYIRLFESNISPQLKWAIKNKIYTGLVKETMIPAKVESKHRMIFLDIEAEGEDEWKEDSDKYPVIIIGFYDIMYNAYYQLYIDNGNVKIDNDMSSYGSNYKLDCERKLIPCKDEKDLFIQYRKIWRKLSPDVVITFSPFDMKYMVSRMKKLDIDPEFLSPVDIVKSRGRLRVGCMDIFDYAEAYRKIFQEKAWHTLDFISMLELGYGKIKLDKQIHDEWKCNPGKVIDYNIIDVKLLKDLESKLHIMRDYIIVLWELTGLSFSECLIKNSLGDILYLRDSEGKQVWRSYSYFKKVPYEGALVYSQPGLHEYVAVLDWSELYPSIMETLHISWDSIAYIKEPGKCIHIAEGLDFSLAVEGQSNKLMKPLRMARKEKKTQSKKSIDKEERQRYKTISEAFKSVINCFDTDTEVLTPNGLKNIKDIKIGDIVYTLNPDTNMVELTDVIATQAFDYNGKLVSIQGTNIDFKVTPNHRFYGLRNKSDRIQKWYEANQVADMYSFRMPKKLPFNSIDNSSDIIDLTTLTALPIKIKDNKFKYNNKNSKWFPRYFDKTDFIKLIAWYISEGSIYVNKRKEYKNGNIKGITYKINIAQEIPEYRIEIENLLNKMDIIYYKTDKSFSFCNQVLATYFINEFGKGSYNKKLNAWLLSLSTKHIEVLFKELMKGDGRKASPTYRTVSKQLETDLIILGEKMGISTHSALDKTNTFTVYFNPKRGCNYLLRRNRHFSEESFNGKVYCFTTEKNHIILAGRNHKLQWVGQSIYGLYGYKLKESNIGSRVYEPSVAAAITMVGRIIFLKVQDFIAEIGYERVYGDTDSIFIKLKHTESKEAMEAEAKEVAFKITVMIAKFIKDTYYVDSTLVMSFDKILRRVVVLTKKRYQGITLDGDPVVKGIEMVRAETAGITALVEKEVGELVLSGRPSSEILAYKNNMIKRFKNKEFNLMEMAFRSIKKQSDDTYKSLTQTYKATLLSEKLFNETIKKGQRCFVFFVIPTKKVTLNYKIEGKPKHGVFWVDVIAVKKIVNLEELLNKYKNCDINSDVGSIVIDYDSMAKRVIEEPINQYLEVLKENTFKQLNLNLYW